MRFIKPVQIIWLIVIVTIFPSSSPAQPLVLDWQSAWSLAQEHNESLASARDEVQKASHQVGEALAGALPTVEFSGTLQHYIEVPSTIFNLPADMNRDPDTGESLGPLRIKTQFGSENNVRANLQLTQPLYVGGKIGIALEIAKHYKELMELGLKVSRQDLHFALIQTFYAAILSDEYLKVSKEALGQAERHRDQVQLMYDQGVVSEYDLIRSRVAVSNLLPQVHEAEAGRELVYKALKNIIGIDVDREIELQGELKVDGEIMAPYDDACKIALEKRLEFRQLELTKELYQGQYKIEKHSWLWPNFLLNLSWETTAQGNNELSLSKYEFLGGYGGALVLQIPLFNGWASNHRAQKAKISIREVERQKDLLERGTRIQVYKALSDYQKAEKESTAADDALEQASRGYEIALVRYSEGIGTQLEILDAQLQVNASKVNLLQAKYNQLVAYAAYQRSLGVIN